MIEALFALYGVGFLVMLGYCLHRAKVDRYLTSIQRAAFPWMGAALWPWTLWSLWRHR
ncbi:hypothetical protein [EBPR siphovirus 2]|nr:hypothetical protein [EBPR siphovirus 2]